MATLNSIAYFFTWTWFVITALMLSRIDLREHRLPNYLVLTSYLGGILGFVLIAITQGDLRVLGTAIAGSLVASLTYLAIHILGGMGMGDVKYAAVVGLYLGSLGWTYVYLGSLISFACAALWALWVLWVLRLLPLRFTGRKSRNVPFGPFMALGVLVSGIIAS
jgi:leader peptidase (prepilin peptidase)/N-methyltransferase